MMIQPQLSDMSATATPIIRGDFNTILNPSIDHCHNSMYTKKSQSAKILHVWMTLDLEEGTH